MNKIFLDLTDRYPLELKSIIYRMRLDLCLIPVFLVLFVEVVHYFPDMEHGLGRAVGFVSSWAFVLTVLWCILRFGYEYLYHHTYRYYIENNSFVVSWGLLRKFRDTSLLTRISDVRINRTFLQRLLGLADIEIFTTNDTLSGTRIPGLSIESCMGVQKTLLEFVDKEELGLSEISDILARTGNAEQLKVIQ